MINTIYGRMDESKLEKKTGRDQYVDTFCDWIEYRLKGEIVHRSVHVTLTGVNNKGEIQTM